MAKVAVTHPGKIGDLLYSIPTVRKVAEKYGPVDFYTSEYCAPAKRLLERQDCVERCIVLDNYRVDNFGCGAQPWHMDIPNKYSYHPVIHLGFRRTPDRPLHEFIARQTIGAAIGPIQYDFSPAQTLNEPYYVLAPRGNTSFKDLFEKFIRLSPIPVVQIGAAGEALGGGIDVTGLDMLDTLPWIANSKGFVGIMSAMLVLANGFDIPKVAPHDGRSWDMRHVVYSRCNFYPVNPTIGEVFNMIGANFCHSKCLHLDDYLVMDEPDHARNIASKFSGRFEHPHRAWEYGIVLNAIRYRCNRVLDVGGGGSVFAPMCAWIGMDVHTVDPGNVGPWITSQILRLPPSGGDLTYDRCDFMQWEGGEYDAVTCISVLEHIEDDMAFVDKLARHVKPGGILALTVDYSVDGEVYTGGHLRTYTVESLHQIGDKLNGAGFKWLDGHDYRKTGGYVNGYNFASAIFERSPNLD